jgi:AraC-like DNA-binding protein
MATKEGFSRSTLDGVKFMRATRFCPRQPVMYEPGVVIIAQGRKRGFLGGEVFTYDARHYLVVSLPLPFECETQPPPDGPLLGVKIRIDIGVLGELMLKAGQRPSVDGTQRAAMYATRLEPALEDAATRLLECMSDERDTAVLGPQIIREITWRVLCGKHGDSLRALAAMHGRIWPIHRILQRLHDHYAHPFDVASLAKDAAMSVSAFHQHFRCATGTSPLQYVKTVRLQKARLLIAHDRLGASEAATKVGYESASQFNREFKRFFGHSPLSEAARLRESWDLHGHVASENILA